MPKITSYTPSWLSRPSPGFDFFSSTPSKQLANGTAKNTSSNSAPLRTIVTRGTELFYAQGNEIRWTELSNLKEQEQIVHQQTNRRSRRDHDDSSALQAYRVLKVPGSRQIRQLLISPNGLYIAIVSSHTVHLAILPDPSHLASEDTSPLKLKTYHVGPTSHVLERSPVASVLWHPLGVNGDCLVTVTADAVVRLWELDRENRWSFDQPALAVDLKKLANGLSTAEDFSPSKYGTSKGFSPDSFEMEVASACFGAASEVSEGSWSPMTLWIAMREGDVYALCPLLPTHFQAQTQHLQQLLTTLRIDFAAVESLEGVPDWARKGLKQYQAWTSDIEDQIANDESYDVTLPTQVLRRPVHPSPVPKLQGPFQLSPDPDQIFDITDICALSAEPRQDLQSDDGASTSEDNSISALETLCLATSDGKIHVCISLSKIEPRWLPLKKTGKLPFPEPDEDVREMLVLESISLVDSTASSWPCFTADVTSAARTFVTHSAGVAQLDISAFQNKLAQELNGEGESGVDFRMGMLVENTQSTCEQCITSDDRTTPTTTHNDTIVCTNLYDPDLGHLVLTSSSGQPSAVTLDTTSLDLDLLQTTTTDDFDLAAELQHLNIAQRPAYQPSPTFWTPSTLFTFLDDHVHSRNRGSLRNEIRLSPASLDILMTVHRSLSTETHKLGLAAADLFARCTRLQDEFQKQIESAREAVERIDAVTRPEGEYEDEGEGADVSVRENVEMRLHGVRTTQEALMIRYEEVRRKVSRLNRRPFSEREREWKGEVERLGSLVLEDVDGVDRVGGTETEVVVDADAVAEGEQSADAEASSLEQNLVIQPETAQRFDEISHLREKLLEQYSEHKAELERKAYQNDGNGNGNGNIMDADMTEKEKEAFGLSVALDRRRARAVEVEMLLERQAAMIEAAREKLGRLRSVVLG